MSLRIVFVQRSNVERGLAVTTDHSDTLRVYGPRKGQLTGADLKWHWKTTSIFPRRVSSGIL
jgi:hypothetical protein